MDYTAPTWTIDQVSQWLRYIGSEKLVDLFERNEIDGKNLLELNTEDLFTMVKVFGDPYKLRDMIQLNAYLRKLKRRVSMVTEEMEQPDIHWESPYTDRGTSPIDWERPDLAAVNDDCFSVPMMDNGSPGFDSYDEELLAVRQNQLNEMQAQILVGDAAADTGIIQESVPMDIDQRQQFLDRSEDITYFVEIPRKKFKKRVFAVKNLNLNIGTFRTAVKKRSKRLRSKEYYKTLRLERARRLEQLSAMAVIGDRYQEKPASIGGSTKNSGGLESAVDATSNASDFMGDNESDILVLNKSVIEESVYISRRRVDPNNPSPGGEYKTPSDIIQASKKIGTNEPIPNDAATPPMPITTESAAIGSHGSNATPNAVTPTPISSTIQTEPAQTKPQPIVASRNGDQLPTTQPKGSINNQQGSRPASPAPSASSMATGNRSPLPSAHLSTKLYAYMYPWKPDLTPVSGTTYRAYVGFAESPLDFTMIEERSHAKLSKLEPILNRVYTKDPYNLPLAHEMIMKNTACVVKFDEDESWYRAVIEKVDANGGIHIRYVDYGNREVVTDRKRLMSLRRDDRLAQNPPLCVQCHLHGIPLNHELTSEQKDEFYDLTEPMKRSFLVKFESTNGEPYAVSLIDSVSYLDVNRTMMEKLGLITAQADFTAPPIEMRACAGAGLSSSLEDEMDKAFWCADVGCDEEEEED